MTDSVLFASGTLFTQDYLSAGILASPEYAAVDIAEIRQRLKVILSGFPHASLPNEATTEQDFVWPVLALLGWRDFLTQQNLSASGRVDVPDGLLFIDAAANTNANAHPEEWRRYGFGAAILEAKRWKRTLDPLPQPRPRPLLGQRPDRRPPRRRHLEMTTNNPSALTLRHRERSEATVLSVKTEPGWRRREVWH